MAKSLGKDDLLSILPPGAGPIVRDCLTTGQKKLREEVNINDRTITWSFFPVVASQVVHCYGADVTDMLNLEAQFRHAQKLESVGQLAAGCRARFQQHPHGHPGICGLPARPRPRGRLPRRRA